MRRKTHEEFVNEMKIKHPHISILGKYTTAREHMKFRCNKHNYEFLTTPDSILAHRFGCKYCGHEYVISRKRKTEEQFIKELGDNANRIILLGHYVDMKTKIKCQCPKCGHIWDAHPDSLKAGGACKKCAMKFVQEGRIKSHTQFLNEIRTYNPHHDTFIVLTEYQKDELPVTCKCKICNRTWTTRARHLINKRHASACHYCYLSKGESQIRHFLEDNNIEHIGQKEFDGLIGLGGRNLRYDFYLPNYNMLIEYQGEFHDNSVPYQSKENYEYQHEHDLRKRKYAEEHGIELFEIWYWDAENIDNILKNKLNIA